MTTTAPALPADLEAGLRRLKLATVRRKAPELFQDAKAQRWAPEELLRALVEAEVAARDASMVRTLRERHRVVRRREDPHPGQGPHQPEPARRPRHPRAA